MLRRELKTGKANTVDIEVTKTRLGALEDRVEEEIADAKWFMEASRGCVAVKSRRRSNTLLEN